MKHLTTSAGLAGLLLLFSAATALALPLSGTVVDQYGDPIIGASVVTNLDGVGAPTDNRGEFELPDRDGITWVTVSAVGFKARQFDADRLPPVIKLEPMYIRGEDILVTADRAELGVTPVAFDNFSQHDIKRDYTVGEFPLLLSSTPNLYAFSDGGGVLGYSYMKIRGFDDKRITTYINGVPLNDPEDQATYFVDLPDFAANVTDIQVQRGVGNSLYGDASFGGSVNIVTSGFSRERQTALSWGYGEYTSGGRSVSGIYKQSVEYSSGLINGRWAFSGRFSKQKTGGYRHNSWYHGWSYYFSMARLDPNMWTELYIYGGPMKMHLAYSGASRAQIALDRQANPYHTYSNETDNFNQPHYHLHNVYRLSDRATLANTLYYIRGKGYYEQFKTNRDFYEYNIDPSMTDGAASGNLVRQQWVEKNQYGWNPRLDITHTRGRHSLGGSFYYFESDHWGQVVWAEHLVDTTNFDPQHRYYQYYGKKWVGSLWAQESHRLGDRWSLLATVQMRYQRYSFDQARMGAFKGYDYTVDWWFFSPRIGLTFTPDDAWTTYASFAVSSRTPTDAAIYDANDPWIMPSLQVESVSLSASGDSVVQFGDPTASSERVYDWELGAQYRRASYQFGINGFWMEFRDEIIPYGGINENTGLAVTVNADRSVHAGIELTGAVKPGRDLTLQGNFAFNYDRIKKYQRKIDTLLVDFADKTIVGSPDYLANFIVEFAPAPVRITGRGQFVGRQYMELYNIKDLSIDPYWTASLSLEYTLGDFLSIGKVILQGRVDNLFDKKFETSGYGDNYLDAVDGKTFVTGWAEYFVGAERTFWTQLRLELL